MKCLVFCLLTYLAALFATAYSANCVVNGHRFKTGEKYYPPRRCEEIICKPDGGTMLVNCGSVGRASSRCTYVPQDNSKPYPQCCPAVKC